MASTPNHGSFGTAPASNPDYQWIQSDPGLNRDRVLQRFIEIYSGTEVYGQTDGFASDHIHLHFLSGEDSGFNLDPVSGEIGKDGNVLGVLAELVAVALVSVASGALGAGGAAAAVTARDLFTPSGDRIPAGLVFPRAA